MTTSEQQTFLDTDVYREFSYENAIRFPDGTYGRTFDIEKALTAITQLRASLAAAELQARQWQEAHARTTDDVAELRTSTMTTPETTYGTCPICGAPGVTRERRLLHGVDRCATGHVYPSVEARHGTPTYETCPRYGACFSHTCTCHPPTTLLALVKGAFREGAYAADCQGADDAIWETSVAKKHLDAWTRGYADALEAVRDVLNGADR